MNGRETPIQCTGPGAGRRAFLEAAAVAMGGALVTCRRSRAQDPQAERHAAPAQAPTAPDDVAFEGMFVTPSAAIIVNERTYGDLLNTEVAVPVLIGDAQEIVRQIKPAAESALTFQTDGIGSPRDVSPIPFYCIAHERYNLYWVTKRPGDALIGS